ncbi:MAG: hypothetical protein NWF01_01205 [Candidatus Bathyarchaeota archaeon]|nr:hypothetical protein [Candidatus Bathyarchaeota archaeon]
MVKRAFVLVVILVLAALCMVGFADAQDRVYSFDHQWAQIFINQDGTIDLIYNLTLTLHSGNQISSIDIGQPKADFTRGTALDQYGNTLQTSDASSGSNYAVNVKLNEPLTAGESIWFTLTTNVAGMIYNDTTNPGNFGMQFAPEWMSVPISDVRVQIVLPPDVPVDEVKTPADAFYNGTSTVEGRLAVYWEKPVLQANEQWLLGVSFPSRYLPDYNPSSDGFGFDAFTLFIIIGAVFFAVIAVIIAIGAARKAKYSSPKISMETLGIKRGLTAPEASYLLGLKPTQIVTEILYSLLKKKAVWAQQAKPLKLQVLPPYEDKIGPKDTPLRYYEIDFLGALKSDGTLDEEKLAAAVTFLEETVEQKMQGFSRKDTVDYYRRIVAEAWTQVTQAGTVELASNAYDEQLLWLMLDPEQKTKTETAFQNRVFMPNPLWFWWWYNYTIYHPHPTIHPNIQSPTQTPQPAAIPGAEFANNVATALEGTANGIVVNLEKFANAIVSPPPKTSHEPAHHKADCVCACAACACACACVSCACACAGGGVH